MNVYVEEGADVNVDLIHLMYRKHQFAFLQTR